MFYDNQTMQNFASTYPNQFTTKQQQNYEIRRVMSLDEARVAQINNNPLLLFDNNNNSIYIKDISENGKLIFKGYKEFDVTAALSQDNSTYNVIIDKMNKYESILQQITKQYDRIIKELGIEDKEDGSK